MAQRSRFFDSTAGDRVYTAEAWAEVIRALQTDGVVVGYGGELAVTESNPPALSVEVALGVIFIQGRLLEVYAAPATLALALADVTNPRIDRIVARLDVTGRTALLVAKEGTPAASPSAPSLTRTASTWEISLARVAVAAGATSVSNANITDERGDAAVGGYGESHDVAALLDLATGHDHDGADSKGVAHSATTGRTANDHHAQIHGHTGADGSGTVAHSATTGRTANDHHAMVHGGGHGLGQADPVTGIDYTFQVTDKPASFPPSWHAASHDFDGGDTITPEAITAWRKGGAWGNQIFVTTVDPGAGSINGDVWIEA